MDKTVHGEIAIEQVWRANTYGFLAKLLALPPALETLAPLRTIPADPDESEPPLARAWRSLAQAAKNNTPKELVEEYQALFIGVTGGEVVPYGSWYLAGFLMEKPLALLRDDLERLGIVRRASVHEPEDHAAALCEVMNILICQEDERQRGFFNVHLRPWMGLFFRDLREAKSARFYRAAADLGRAFIELEKEYLALEARR